MNVAILLVVAPEQTVLFRDRLRQIGHTVIPATVADAMRKAVDASPVLALIDPNAIGPMDGIELAQQLQMRLRLGIVFVTAALDETQLDRAESLKPLGYIGLPCDLASLENIITILLRRHVRNRQIGPDQIRQSIFEQVDVGLVATDVTGTILMMNPVAEALSGWTASEAIGIEYLKVLVTLDPDTLQPIECEAGRRGADLGSSGQFVLFQRRDGERTPMLVSLTALTRADRKLAGLVFAFRPYHAFTELRASKQNAQHLQSLVDHVPVGMWTCDNSGQIVDRSNTLVQFFGEGLSIGAKWLDWIQPGDTRKNLDPLIDVIEGKTRAGEAIVRLRAGTADAFLVRLRRFDGEGNRAIIGAIVPIPQQGLADPSRERTLILDVLQRVLGQVSYRLSHSAVRLKGQSRLLLQQLHRPESTLDLAIAQTQTIRDGLERQMAVLTSLADFACASVIREQEVNLVELVNTLRGEITETLGTTCTLRIESTMGLSTVIADPQAVRQLLMILATNARDAITAGGRWTLMLYPTTLAEKTGETLPRLAPGEYITLEATDTGSGMAEEVRDRVFEPLYSTRGSTDRITGLGLATVFGLMDRIGGGVAVRSAPGQGTTIRLFFPVWQNAVADRPIALIVEEDRELRRQLQGWLRDAGYDAIPTRNSSEALVAAAHQSDRLSLLVSQVPLAQTSCRDLLAELERLRPGLQVLCCSSQPRDLLVYLGLIDSSWGFVAKPISETALLASLDRLNPIANSPSAKGR